MAQMIFVVLMSHFVLGQDLKTAIFSEANSALKEAEKVKANILAPKAFSEGLDLYQKAEADYKKEKISMISGAIFDWRPPDFKRQLKPLN